MQLCRLLTRFFFYLVAGSSLVAGLSIPPFFKRSRERPSTLMMSASENVIGVIDLQHYLVEEIKTLLRVVGGRRGRDIEGSYDGTVPIPIHDVLQLQQELSAFDYQLRTILDSACNLTTIRAPATTTGPVSARVNVNERRGTSTTLRCFTSTNTSSFTAPTGTLPLDALHATPEPSLAASNRTGLWIPSSPAISRSTYLILPTISASSSLSPILGPHLNASSSNITSSPSLSTDFIKYEPTTSRVAPVRDSSGIPFRDTLTPSTSEASALETSITHASYENPTLSPTVRRTFNPQASNNVAVYFGQTRNTGSTTLLAQCQDPNVDIVILAFLVTFFGPGGYPVINFGAACGGQTPEQVAKAPGLLYCPALALQISQCQALGKPVLLSLGGAVADAKFDHEHQAAEFASTLWNLFGSGTGEDPGLRPFGQVQVDGFDIGESFSRTYHSR